MDVSKCEIAEEHDRKNKRSLMKRKDITKLSPELATKLRAAERRAIGLDTLKGILIIILGLAGSWLLLFVSDRFWNTPVLLRGMLFLGAMAILVSVMVWWCRRQWIRLTNPALLIRRIERFFPRLGDGLEGVIELAAENEPDSAENSSRLRNAAMEQVTAQTSGMDFRKAVPMTPLRRPTQGVGGIAIIFAVLAVVDTSALKTTTHRWWRPSASITRYTFTNLESLPQVKRVLHNQPFHVRVKLHSDSVLLPDTLHYRLEKTRKGTTPFADDEAIINSPGVTENKQLAIRAGDALQNVRICPVQRPELVRVEANVTYPDYLGMPPENKEVSLDKLKVPAGSRVKLTGVISRPLKEAWMKLDGNEKTNIRIRKNHFVTPELPPQTEQITFGWRGRYGFQPAESLTIPFEYQADRRPRVNLEKASGKKMILENEPLTLTVLASDDHGLRHLNLMWEVLEGGEKRRFQRRLKQGDKTTSELKARTSFVPQLNDLSDGTLIQIKASAEDFCPQHRPSYSSVYRVSIRSADEHEMMLADKLNKFEIRIDGLLRRESMLKQVTDKLKRLKNEKLAAERYRKRLLRQREKEKKTELQSKNLTNDLRQCLKQALRNSRIDEYTLQKWQRNLRVLNKISERYMPNVTGLLSDAVDLPSRRRTKIEQAAAIQKKILEKLETIAEDLNKIQRNMRVLRFARRLQKLASGEQEVAEAYLRILPEIVGTPVKELSEEMERKITRLTKKQQDVRQSALNLHKELNDSYERTNLEAYHEISHSMRNRQMGRRLHQLVSRFRKNKGITVAEEAERWAENFRKWSNLLSTQAKSRKSKEADREARQRRTWIKLMRIIQSEKVLRDKTRALREQRNKLRDYAEKALKFGREQDDLRTRLNDFREGKSFGAGPEKILDKTDKFMGKAATELRQRNTGQEVISAQNAALKLLMSLFKQGSGKKKSGEGDLLEAPAELAKMAQELAGRGGAGSSAGGNTAGGSFDDANVEVSGESDAKPAEREPENEGTAGISREKLPVEYRKVLETYFRRRGEMQP